MLGEDTSEELRAEFLVGDHRAVELHHAAVGSHDAGRGILKHVAQGRPGVVMFAEEFEALRVLFLHAGQGRADAIPTGEVEPGLAPSKHPRDGAKVFQRGCTRAARGTRTNAASFNDVDGGGLTEEFNEFRRTDEALIRFARELRETVHDFAQGNVIGFELFIE